MQAGLINVAFLEARGSIVRSWVLLFLAECLNPIVMALQFSRVIRRTGVTGYGPNVFRYMYLLLWHSVAAGWLHKALLDRRIELWKLNPCSCTWQYGSVLTQIKSEHACVENHVDFMHSIVCIHGIVWSRYRSSCMEGFTSSFRSVQHHAMFTGVSSMADGRDKNERGGCSGPKIFRVNCGFEYPK